MYDRVLFPTDGSDAATAALDYARDVVSTHDSALHVLHVVETPPAGVTDRGEDLVGSLERDGERIVDETATRLEDQGTPVVTDILRGVPHEEIVSYCETHEVDLVVMPTHGRGDLDRFLLGSVTERVVNSSPVPVLTVTPDEVDEFVYPPGDVLVPTDGSRGADRALREAVDVSNAVGATLHLLHVIETADIEVHSPETRDELERRATEILEAATETAREASTSTTGSFTYGYPYREIRSYVGEQGIDLVALGTHGRTEFSRHVLGGVSTKLLRTSPVPVLMVREPNSSG